MDNRAETTDGKRVKSYLDQVEVVENHLHPERTWHIKENEELTIFKSYKKITNYDSFINLHQELCY